jgi:radical SAM additional 4Fe4S-binding domain
MENEKKSDNSWHSSRYNLFARIPGTDRYACVNVFYGSCTEYSKAELYLLSEVENLSNDHPIIDHFRKNGVVVNYDELKALDAMGRLSSASAPSVNLTICPTMACNMRCPYCYETKNTTSMSREVQDDVAALAERMIDASRARKFAVRWYGGEPLLVPGIVENLSQRLMEIAGDRGVEYKAWMFTNGYMLTQDIANMLGRCGLSLAYITVDGIGEVHDKSRPLAGGGSSFERIVENLRTLKLPFRVKVRQNLYAGNFTQAAEVEDLVKRLADESGNDLEYYATDVRKIFEDKGEQTDILSDEIYSSWYRERFNGHIGPARGIRCDAGDMWSVGINPEGRLFKCWEIQDDNSMSFASAASWNPKDPIRTADHPDMFTKYFTDYVPFHSDECRNCKWLPMCLGQCPLFRQQKKNTCIFWKNNEEAYVLSIYRNMQRMREEKNGG